jgi:hypothetical protein
MLSIILYFENRMHTLLSYCDLQFLCYFTLQWSYLIRLDNSILFLLLLCLVTKHNQAAKTYLIAYP